ncbi:unnamed protein product [Cuscuta campestris]|uniref:C2H2-type domain-containing protein n=1 Tax=Cuscuta campestris TaxID=132261 RepID=A0A484K9J3_9ASTE|nr:unnamed protein product [Cuscuta campestris]
MDALEEVVVGGPNDLSLPIANKGKRTKRSKPHSPIISFTMVTPSPHSSSAAGDDDNTASGASASGGGFALILHDTPPTAEDEDMARCLMLLSRGGTPSYKEEDIGAYNNNNNNNYVGSKFCSKKYVETSAVGGGAKVGMYVYECKTCGRTFPTFQALGGHRTSHTKEKPVLAIEAAKRPVALAFYDGGDEDYDPSPPNKTARACFSPLHLNDFAKSSPRIHECSYCGAEFTSGQALGGHMRRHRGAATAATVASCSFEKRVFQKDNHGDSLNLDLNLAPAGELDVGRNWIELKETRMS